MSLIISKPENVLKTYLQSGSTGHTENRTYSVIIDVLCGEIDFIFSDTTITCNKNRSIFIPEGTDYRIHCKEYAENLLFNFHAVNLSEKPFPLPAPDRAVVEELFYNADLLFNNKEASQNQLMVVYYQLFAEVFDKTEATAKTELLIQKAQQIMINRFNNPSLSCTTLAKELNISEVYLRKLFVKHLHIPPSRYLCELRMKKARLYLKEGCSVFETAQNVGYSDIYQFSRAYKKYYGYAPSHTSGRSNTI